VVIPADYPNERPNVFFETKVWHPLVDWETGLLNLGPKFLTWKPRKDFIFSVLGYVKQVFLNKGYVKEDRFIMNELARELVKTDERKFWRHVKIYAAESRT
jgi:ubiquitin-protein ligase